MYRLLIITRKQATEQMFSGMTQADLGDFKAPHFRRDCAGALECLEKHAIDAVAFDDDDEAFFRYLTEHRPEVPIFTIGKDLAEQKEYLRELDCLLIRLNADISSNADCGHSSMENERKRWLHQVICGKETAQKDIQRRSFLYRCSRKIDTALWFYRFSIPEDDDFVSERWHYGSERLETALSNFFGKEYEGTALHIAVVSPVEVRMICIPKDGKKLPDAKHLDRYIQDTLAHVSYYLGLQMKVAECQKLAGLHAFAESRHF